MRIKRFFICLVLLLGVTFSIAIAQQETTEPPKMTTLTPVKIERASVLFPGERALDVGLAFEFDREWRDLDYNNYRLAPLSLRY